MLAESETTLPQQAQDDQEVSSTSGTGSEPCYRQSSPSPEKVSVADAMLKLSTSAPLGEGVPGSTSLYPNGMYSEQMLTPQAGGSGLVSTETSPATEGEGPWQGFDEQHGEEDAESRQQRKRRKFIPEQAKDDHYWLKRRKNNEAAKRSREKRRMNDMAMGQKILELSTQNDMLKRELEALKEGQYKPPCQPVPVEHVHATSVSPTVSPPQTMGAPHVAVPVFESPVKTPVLPHAIPVSVDQYHAQPGSAVVSAPPALQPQPPAGNTPVAQYQAEPPALQTVPVFREMPVLIPAPAVPPIPTQGNGSNSSTSSSHTSSQSTQPVLFQHTSTTSPSPVNSPPSSCPSQVIAPPPGADAAPPVTSMPPLLPMSAIEITPLTPDSGSSSPRSLKISLSGDDDTSDSEHDKSREQEPYQQGAAPLDLTTRGTDEEDSTNDSSSTSEITSSEERIRDMAAVPHKLRHKQAFRMALGNYHNSGSNPSWQSTAGSTSSHTPSLPTTSSILAAAGQDVLAQSQHLQQPEYPQPLNPGDEQGASDVDSRHHDPRYVERRRRNNQAARKCRENRKVLNEMRVIKSNLLEAENNRLKEEIATLTQEITNLRRLLQEKDEAAEKGEPWKPPPREDEPSDKTDQDT